MHPHRPFRIARNTLCFSLAVAVLCIQPALAWGDSCGCGGKKAKIENSTCQTKYPVAGNSCTKKTKSCCPSTKANSCRSEKRAEADNSSTLSQDTGCGCRSSANSCGCTDCQCGDPNQRPSCPVGIPTDTNQTQTQTYDNFQTECLSDSIYPKYPPGSHFIFSYLTYRTPLQTCVLLSRFTC